METWRAIAFRQLKTKQPERFEEMSVEELRRYLNEKVERAQQTYKATVKRAEKDGHPAWFARKMVEELVIRDILDPTT